MAAPVEEYETVKKDDPDGSISVFLNFASRAQALIAELLLLSGRVPHEFTDRRYDPVLFDLRYFDFPDDFEERIEGNAELEALEDQLRESCSVFLRRFFLLANGIVAYYQEIVKYLDDLQEGAYVQSTLETIIENDNGRQLLSESLALFGCLLLLLEHRMNGFLREKLLVAHIRHERCFDAPNLDFIYLLCRVYPSASGPPSSSTPSFVSFRPLYSSPPMSTMILVQKPEDLFARFRFPKRVVDAVICRLRDDDLYNRVQHYPDPEQRTVALASQAGCLYVLLLYSPQFLHDSFVMREIVDRFFRDCWVVPIFLYFLVDLSISWDAYKAAKTSLSSCLSPAFVRDISQIHCTKSGAAERKNLRLVEMVNSMIIGSGLALNLWREAFQPTITRQVKDLLLQIDTIHSDVILTGDYVLNNSQTLLSLVRNCNVSLRWLLLHRCSVDRKLRDIVISVGATHQVEEETLLLLLLKTSHVEFEVKQFYIDLLQGREHQWHGNKCHASECLKELSACFSVSKDFPWKINNENLKDWFEELSLQVLSLDYEKTGNVGQKLYRVISALKEVQQFHQIEANLQINQYLSLVQKYLQDMLKALGLQHNTLATFSVITDAAYAWGLVGSFAERLHKKIVQDPSIVLDLHAFFLKFHSSLDLPLLRISQNCSSDLLAVSNYYSSELVSYICAVLEIVPVVVDLLFQVLLASCDTQNRTSNMARKNGSFKSLGGDMTVILFKILNDDMGFFLQPLHLPSRIERDNLQGLLQLEQRLPLATTVHKLSIYSEGMVVMSRAFLGVIDLNMKNWIEGQIRKELSKQIENKLNSFPLLQNVELKELETNMQTVMTSILSQLQLMECFQDLIHIQGQRVWEEELTRILKRSAREEYSDYIKRRRQHSIFTHIQLNDFSKAQTFLGRLLQNVLQLTNPSRSMYIEPMIGIATVCLHMWTVDLHESTVHMDELNRFDAGGHELLGLHFFYLLESCAGPIGMSSLDSLLICLIMENIDHALSDLKNQLDTRCLEELQTFDNPLLGLSRYKQMTKIVDPSWEPWVECIASVGQLQLLRCLLSLKLRSASKVKASSVSFAVEGMIGSVFSQRKNELKGVEHWKTLKECNGKMNAFLQELRKQGMLCGFCSPLRTLYISKGPPAFLAQLACVITISQLSRYVLDTHLGTLTSRLKKVSLDFSPMVIGLGTFLRQFDSTYMTQYVEYMGQYVQTLAETALGPPYNSHKGSVDPSSLEILKAAVWLLYFCKYMEVPKDLLDSCLPPSLLTTLAT